MDILLYVGIFIVSLTILLKASDWFVESAETIGLSLGISPFIIGVTIVAFGTSLPELATSIASVLDGQSEIVLGNVVGSNITNIALVLGISAVVAKNIQLEVNLWNNDMPILWGSAFLLWLTVRDQNFELYEAIIFIFGIIVFLANSFGADTSDGLDERPKADAKTYGLLILGGALVWLSADYTIVAIKQLSLMAGISSEMIAKTVVALGTSLPEVIVSLAAVKRGKASIAVGNVLGSNIFNTFIVMAIPSFFGKLTISESMLETSIPIMLIMTILFGVISTSKNISRTEGLILLVFYGYFMADSIQSIL